MRKSVSWFLLAVLVALPSLSISAQRGIKVTAKTQDGKSIPLYEESYALVIGNGNYTRGWDSLPGASKDADDVAKALERNGFQVTLKKDLTKSAFAAALSAFFNGLRTGSQQPPPVLLCRTRVHAEAGYGRGTGLPGYGGCAGA